MLPNSGVISGWNSAGSPVGGSYPSRGLGGRPAPPGYSRVASSKLMSSPSTSPSVLGASNVPGVALAGGSSASSSSVSELAGGAPRSSPIPQPPGSSMNSGADGSPPSPGEISIWYSGSSVPIPNGPLSSP